MKSKTLAAIDIGTNTFRLLVAEVNKDCLNELYSERIITRLGSGISISRTLKNDAIENGLIALRKFRSVISNFRIDAISAVGTSALREAINSDLFLTKAKRETGFDIKIISEEEEAIMTSIGMLMDLSSPEICLLIDIGGGSTEFIFVKAGKIISTHSLCLGVLYTADKYMKHDPLYETDIISMNRNIKEAVEIVKSVKKEFSDASVLVGTGGTVTTLSAIAQGLDEFNQDKIHNSRLSLQKVSDIHTEISSISSVERAVKYPILESSRLDIIVPGTLILNIIMMTFGFKEVIVSSNGLRKGLLIDLYRKLSEPS
jgi:exopolyphosphatase/guanosine-5'-triphosphate,3'-diphosphate pyrophosphatase